MSEATVPERKLPCGCYAEWTGFAWRIAAASFLCAHRQRDYIYGMAPPAPLDPPRPAQ